MNSDLPPETLSILVAETYRLWLNFALGKTALGGKTLSHPSGNYAACLSWKKTGVASFAIIADEAKAPEALWIEQGKSSYEGLKELMLSKGKVSKKGNRYRIIPIGNNDSPEPSLDMGSIITTPSSERLPAGQARIWAKSANTGSARFVTMSDNSPSEWILPSIPAYSPAYILSQLLKKSISDRERV